jgi:hypothetical protein
MQLAITLNEDDLVLAITKHIQDELGIESEVSVTTLSDGTYSVTATAGEAKPAQKRTRRTKGQIAATEDPVPMAPLEDPAVHSVSDTINDLIHSDVPLEEPANLFAISPSSVFGG